MAHCTRILPLLLVLLLVGARDGTPFSTRRWYSPVSRDSSCRYLGQYLPLPADTCAYQVCDYNPSTGVYSKGVQLMPRRMPCAPGTYVQNNVVGEASKGEAACTGIHQGICHQRRYGKQVKGRDVSSREPLNFKPRFSFRSSRLSRRRSSRNRSGGRARSRGSSRVWHSGRNRGRNRSRSRSRSRSSNSVTTTVWLPDAKKLNHIVQEQKTRLKSMGKQDMLLMASSLWWALQRHLDHLVSSSKTTTTEELKDSWSRMRKYMREMIAEGYKRIGKRGPGVGGDGSDPRKWSFRYSYSGNSKSNSLGQMTMKNRLADDMAPQNFGGGRNMDPWSSGSNDEFSSDPWAMTMSSSAFKSDENKYLDSEVENPYMMDMSQMDRYGMESQQMDSYGGGFDNDIYEGQVSSMEKRKPMYEIDMHSGRDEGKGWWESLRNLSTKMLDIMEELLKLQWEESKRQMKKRYKMARMKLRRTSMMNKRLEMMSEPPKPYIPRRPQSRPSRMLGVVEWASKRPKPVRWSMYGSLADDFDPALRLVSGNH